MRPALALALSAVLALAGCGDEGDDEATVPQGASGATGEEGPQADPNALEPELGPGTDFCGEFQAGNEFVFRPFASVPCKEAEAVIRAVLEGSPPPGWSCEMEGRPSFSLTTCIKNGDEVGFNLE